MTVLNKITLILVAAIFIMLSIWIMLLRGKLNKQGREDNHAWEIQYKNAQDSIDIISGERDILRKERDKLDSLSVYWATQYNQKDKLLKRIKSQHNEKMDNIRNANASSINRILAEKLDSISKHRN